MVRYRNFTEAWQFPSIAVLVFSNFFRNFRENTRKIRNDTVQEFYQGLLCTELWNKINIVVGNF